MSSCLVCGAGVRGHLGLLGYELAVVCLDHKTSLTVVRSISIAFGVDSAKYSTRYGF